ncbi:hypothetical protein [Collinsella tanakaei]|uniref:hypothetical protein n=1 Tax=Collinsella tanakaei TaxID=626935 RepID=UPI0025A386F8|nr:hypothetical protein [Collinsella tanakaei]
MFFIAASVWVAATVACGVRAGLKVSDGLFDAVDFVHFDERLQKSTLSSFPAIGKP